MRPGAVQQDELAAVERLLDTAPRERGQTARLVGPDGAAIELPRDIHALLVSIVENLKAGKGVSVIPLHAELTTVEAAELLNVSRPFLIKQLDAGALPHHLVGTHRRLRLPDVLTYRDRLEANASNGLTGLSQEAEDLGLYDRPDGHRGHPPALPTVLVTADPRRTHTQPRPKTGPPQPRHCERH